MIRGMDYEMIKQGGLSFNHMIGVVNKMDSNRLKRMIFRITKGNSYVMLQDLKEIEMEEAIDDENVKIIIF